MHRRQIFFPALVLTFLCVVIGAFIYGMAHSRYKVQQTYQIQYRDGAVYGLDLNNNIFYLFRVSLNGEDNEVVRLPVNLDSYGMDSLVLEKDENGWNIVSEEDGEVPEEILAEPSSFSLSDMTDVRYYGDEDLYAGIRMLEDGRQVPACFGSFEKTFSELSLPLGFWIKDTILYGALGILAAGAYFGLIWIFRKREGGFPLWGKMVLIVAPVFLAGSVALNNVIRSQMEKQIEENEILLVTDFGKAQLYEMDSEWLESLVNQMGENATDYFDYSENLRLFYKKNGEIYSASQEYDQDLPMSLQAPAYVIHAMEQVLSSGTPAHIRWSRKGEALSNVFIPVRDSSGETVAVLESSLDLRGAAQEGEKYIEEIQNLILQVSLALLGLIFLIIILNMRLLSHVKAALFSAGNGNLESYVRARGSSEAAGLGRAFNEMLKDIGSHMRDLEEFQKKYRAFVPEQEFCLMGNKDATEIKVGDWGEVETALMTLRQENLSEWNCRGIVHKLETGGMECLYPGNEKETLDDAITFLQENTGSPAVISLVYGRIRLGVLGTERRAVPVLVSEGEGLSGFLCRKAEEYNATLLVTDRFFRRLGARASTYNVRVLGYIYLNLTERLEKIYEILDGEPEERGLHKKNTKENFEAGVAAFMSGNFLEARRYFVWIIDENREDGAAKRYVDLCDQRVARESLQTICCLDTY